MRTSLDALVDAEQAETRRAQKSRSKKKRSETALKAQRPGPDTKLGAVATHGGTGKK